MHPIFFGSRIWVRVGLLEPKPKADKSDLPENPYPYPNPKNLLFSGLKFFKSELKSGKLISLDECSKYYDQLEPWSQLGINFIKNKNSASLCQIINKFRGKAPRNMISTFFKNSLRQN